MQVLNHGMGNLRWTTRVAETPADLAEFLKWTADRRRRGEFVAIDTETTGVEVFGAGHRLRLAQFGIAREAWIIPVELGAPFAAAARDALEHLPRLAAHNATYDALVVEKHLRLPLEELWARVRDTRIYAHLVDARKESEGGVGHALKNLAAHYVDSAATDGQTELLAEFRAIGADKRTGWARIPWNNPVYLRYAAADVVLVARLLPRIVAEVSALGIPRTLVDYEHRIARIGAAVKRRGMLLDADYTRRLVNDLEREAEHYAAVARRYGVTSVNAPRQVADALTGMGEVLTERTSSGQFSVGKEVLLALADLNPQWERLGVREPNPLADAVLRSKRAGKWATSYARAMLELADPAGYIHPDVNTMGARTARWSVSNPPLQQLPSSDWRIRRCIIAPPGHVVVASDFAQVELRVLAALAGADDIVSAINAGQDLHDFTTRLVFGIPEGAPVPAAQRKLCKTISLGKAYAGGARALARQTGLPLPQVQAAVSAYDRELPEIARFARRLARHAQENGMTVKTPSGRILRLDRDKSYTAVAYLCQSTARDILGQALCDIEDAGLLGNVFGVVHDEVLAYAPREHAREVADALGECMRMPFFGVQIESSPEIYGTSWGDGYGCPDSARYTA